jgi:hypothetical protein
VDTGVPGTVHHTAYTILIVCARYSTSYSIHYTNRVCHQDQPGSNEEFTTAVCMRELGIKPGTSYDNKGRERFLIFQPADHLDIKKVQNDWYVDTLHDAHLMNDWYDNRLYDNQ